MQVLPKSDAAAHFGRIVAREVPGGRGLPAWDALLRAHATLLRQLETDLESKTGLALADFEVLAQLAIAGGSLRMSDLADRALISRSGMTRRVNRRLREGHPRLHLSLAGASKADHRNQSGYSSFRQARGSSGWAFGVRSSRKLK